MGLNTAVFYRDVNEYSWLKTNDTHICETFAMEYDIKFNEKRQYPYCLATVTLQSGI